MVSEFLEMARRYRMAVVFTDSPKFPSFANLTTDFVYLRLMNAQADVPTGYTPDALSAVAACAQAWAGGGEPSGLPLVPGDTGAPAASARDVFVFMINGAKERAPAAAVDLIGRLRA
jgi:uncharacterized protein YecE (DUF72 family)